jgi:hypothetical protein
MPAHNLSARGGADPAVRHMRPSLLAGLCRHWLRSSAEGGGNLYGVSVTGVIRSAINRWFLGPANDAGPPCPSASRFKPTPPVPPQVITIPVYTCSNVATFGANCADDHTAEGSRRFTRSLRPRPAAKDHGRGREAVRQFLTLVRRRACGEVWSIPPRTVSV